MPMLEGTGSIGLGPANTCRAAGPQARICLRLPVTLRQPECRPVTSRLLKAARPALHRLGRLSRICKKSSEVLTLGCPVCTRTATTTAEFLQPQAELCRADYFRVRCLPLATEDPPLVGWLVTKALMDRVASGSNLRFERIPRY